MSNHKNLIFFNKEGDYLNFNYNDKTNFHYNRGNVAEENRNELYDSMPHMTVDELIPIFDQILKDEHHRIKKIHLSA